MPKRIDLGNNIYSLIDDEYNYLNKFKWFKSPHGYAIRTDNKKRKRFCIHREVLNITDPNIEVDHINGNKLDNRKCNLRACSRLENSKNLTKIRTNKTSLYKGVSKHKNGSWISQISINSQKVYLGSFKTELAAAIAYNEASNSLHQDFGFNNNTVINVVDFNLYEILPRAVTIKTMFTYKVSCSNGRVYNSILDAAIDLQVKPNTIVKACSQPWRKVKGHKVSYLGKVTYFKQMT